MKNGTLLILAAAAYFFTRKKAPKPQPVPAPDLQPTPEQPPTLAPSGNSMFSMTTPRPTLPATALQARAMPGNIKDQTSIPGLTVIKKPGAPGLNFGEAKAGMTRGTITIG